MLQRTACVVQEAHSGAFSCCTGGQQVLCSAAAYSRCTFDHSMPVLLYLVRAVALLCIARAALLAVSAASLAIAAALLAV